MIVEYIKLTLGIVFWTALGLVVYSYLLYPFIITILAVLFGKKRKPGEIDRLPRVALFVAAYNEEQVIGEKVKNSLHLDYPPKLFQLAIGCDGCADRTADIIRQTEDERILLLDYKERSGKIGVHNKSIPNLDCDIVVYSDANIHFYPQTVKELIRPFADPAVGIVSGGLLVKAAEGGDTGEGFYWKYESYLKKMESKFGTALGATGPIFAMRKELFEPMDANTLVEDFVLPMTLVSRGVRHIDLGVILAEEEQAPDIRSEFTRKVRIGAGGYQAMYMLPGAFNPFRFRVFFPYFSHKVLRWLAPFLLIIALLATIALTALGSFTYLLLLAFALFILALGIIGHFLERRGTRVFGISQLYYILSMNLAYLFGFFRLITCKQTTKWKKGRK